MRMVISAHVLHSTGIREVNLPENSTIVGFHKVGAKFAILALHPETPQEDTSETHAVVVIGKGGEEVPAGYDFRIVGTCSEDMGLTQWACFELIPKAS